MNGRPCTVTTDDVVRELQQRGAGRDRLGYDYVNFFPSHNVPRQRDPAKAAAVGRALSIRREGDARIERSHTSADAEEGDVTAAGAGEWQPSPSR
jgi:hypothetical protein